MAEAVASEAALQAAAQWFAVIRAHSATELEHQHWQSWLAEHPDHRLAWEYVERISARFAPVRDAGHADTAAVILQDNKARQQQRRRMMQRLVMLAGVGVTGAGIWRYTVLPDKLIAWSADYHTGVGEQREVTLSDGARVWLNTASAFNVNYKKDVRQLQLIAGEIMVITAADNAPTPRPFVVDSPHGRMQALGTGFVVRLVEGRTYLAVHQGAVQIQSKNGGTMVIHAGAQTRFDQDMIDTPSTANRAAMAWSKGVLLSEDMALETFVAELNRYWNGHISVVDAVKDIRIFGSYPVGDIDHALAMLAKVAPVEIRKVMPWWITIDARKAVPGSAT